MKYDGTNLGKVLAEHQIWLLNQGTEGSMADFSNTCLNYMNLADRCLKYANFHGSQLVCTNLSRTSLNCADMSDTNLTEALLYDANLSGTNFKNAVFTRTHIEKAFCDCTDFSVAKVQPELPICCPEYGSFIGWKKCNHEIYNYWIIVKLLIPENAKRTSSTSRKCRADRAVVLEMQDLNGNVLEETRAVSAYNPNFIYEVGETVIPDKPFDENRWNECSSGIHFFITRQEAVNY